MQSQQVTQATYATDLKIKKYLMAYSFFDTCALLFTFCDYQVGTSKTLASEGVMVGG